MRYSVGDVVRWNHNNDVFCVKELVPKCVNLTRGSIDKYMLLDLLTGHVFASECSYFDGNTTVVGARDGEG